MWNITSSSLQHAKDELMVRRTEFETRYAEERQALDAEQAVIETLERAASEFMLRRARKTDVAETAPPVDPPGAETENAGAPFELPERDSMEASLEAAAAEAVPAAGGDVGPALDILKPGSRWRFYRGGHAPDAEGDAGEPSASGG